MSDIGALLRRRASDRVSVSLPATPVLLDAAVADGTGSRGGQRAGQRRSARGPDARAFVLLEDLGDSVMVSIRDDGVGIPAGRLAEAVGEGRVGYQNRLWDG